MATLEEIKQTIKTMDGMSKFLGRRELKELPSILWEDEKVERLVSGIYNGGNGILTASNKRLIFVDKGLLGGLRVEDFPYDKITSIQYKLGILLGEITIYASGNKADITHVDKTLTRNFAEHVRARITSISSSATTPVIATAVSDDIVSRLERLAALKQQGILTDEEFLHQKHSLLGTPVPTKPRVESVEKSNPLVDVSEVSLADAEERVARHSLDNARQLIQDGKKADAVNALKDIVARYPNTRSAHLAQDALSKRNKNRD